MERGGPSLPVCKGLEEGAGGLNVCDRMLSSPRAEGRKERSSEPAGGWGWGVGVRVRVSGKVTR